MPPLLNPEPINSPFGDPGLFVPFFHEKRALLFDLGDISVLSAKDILKITHCFVSHTHMDHFIGFDHLLRITLGREKALHIFGPKGIHENVAGKLAGYTWNLVENYESPVTLLVTEVSEDRRETKRYECRNRFLASPVSDVPCAGSAPSVLVDENTFRVETVVLDHGIPCLGFCVKEHFHVNIRREMLEKMNLKPGRWLYEFKQMIHARYAPDTPVPAVCRQSGAVFNIALGELREKLVLIRRGRKIAYITDAAGTPENIGAIVGLVKDCDHLFIEAPFLERERRQAGLKKHLTAFAAGRIAGEANVSRFTLFHFSPRYRGSEKALEEEAMDGFRRPRD